MIDAPAVKRVYLDTNAFIKAFEHQGRVSELLISLFAFEPARDRSLLVTSHLTLSELLVKPLELGRSDLVQLYDNWTITNSYIEAVPVVRDVLTDAARLRAQDKSLKLPDAIHLTTALGTGCSHFVTDDARIKERPGLQIVRLTEESISNLVEDVKRGL